MTITTKQITYNIDKTLLQTNFQLKCRLRLCMYNNVCVCVSNDGSKKACIWYIATEAILAIQS